MSTPSKRWSVGIVSSMDIAGIPEMCSVRIRYSDNADLLVELTKLDDGTWSVAMKDLKPEPKAS